MDWQQIWEGILEWLTHEGVKILISILICFFSFRIINLIGKKILKKLEKNQERQRLDKTAVRTLTHIGKIVLKCLVVFCLVGYLGVDTGGLTALVASLGVCAGLAVNGALSNFAGGILLMITKPFSDDDYISACGHEGTVEDIFICYTKLRTPDNKVVYLPNGTLSSGSIVNYSEKEFRRVDLTFSISYDEDFDRVQKVILSLCDAHPLICREPAAAVRISEHADSAIGVSVKVWVKSGDYWAVYFDLMEQVKRTFDAEGISIPYPQVDVHLSKEENK